MAKETLDISIDDGSVGCTNELKFWPVTLKGSANQKVVFIDTKGIGRCVKDEDETTFITKMGDEIKRIRNIHMGLLFFINETMLSGSTLT